ncbi:MAG: STAS domain-containing protein [Spirochaetia bacterium]
MKQENDLFVVSLEERVSIEQASELSKDLLKALNNYHSVKVDIQKAEKIDASIFQVLLSAKYYAIKKKKQFSIVGNPQKMVLSHFNVSGIDVSELDSYIQDDSAFYLSFQTPQVGEES